MNKEKRMVKFIIGDGTPIRTVTPDRNAKCACGSGKKFKQCCGTQTRYYSLKPKVKPDVSHTIQESIDSKYPVTKAT